MNKVIIVTGASRGIGRNIAYNLAIEGNDVIANYNKSYDVINEAKHLNTKDEITAVFREDITKTPKTFEGVKLESVFGSIQYDLSSSSIKKDALVTASAVFGSVKIKVPKDVEVKFRKNAIFGDAIDRTEEKDSKSTIYVDANAVFGSVIVDDN